jgi:light-regulated signal transduction histidine kinase (bacteriophytochrome)
MNQQLSPHMTFTPHDSSVARSTLDPSQAGWKALSFDEFVHEIRQPLGVIESLAYYLELTSQDETVSAHLQRIQQMVLQAHRILERTCVPEGALAFASSFR